MAKEMTAKELSRKGGIAKREKHGSKAFSDMGKKGHKARMKKDPGFYQYIRQKTIQRAVAHDLGDSWFEDEEEPKKKLSWRTLRDMFRG